MLTFYHVSRTNALVEGQKLTLDYPDIANHFLNFQFSELYAEGVSYFGHNYLLNGKIDTNKNNINQYLEAVFEWVRRAEFPQMPSRFQSYFACESIQLAKSFITQFPVYNEKDTSKTSCQCIWEVQCNRAEKVDMFFLNAGTNLLASMGHARNYWAKRVSPNPFWEILMIPPIEVVRLVS